MTQVAEVGREAVHCAVEGALGQALVRGVVLLGEEEGDDVDRVCHPTVL